MSEMKLELQLRLQDKMSNALKAALRSVQDGTKNLTGEVRNLNKVSQARQALGIRSETAIQREITRTQAAYSRLAKSGVLGSRELARAKDAELKKIRELNTELGKGANLYGKLQKAAAIGAGVAAGAYVAGRVLAPAMGFEKKMAIMSNTAYGGSLENRKAGRAKLSTAIDNAVRVGGGNRDDAAETLNSLIGSGAMGEGQAGVDSSMRILPTIQKVSSQTGASGAELASLVQSMKQQLNMSDGDVTVGLSKAIVAGQQGGFNINNMAKWLPQQISLAKQNGMTGMKGFETLIAANQATRITAGTEDEAGNNLVNLLAKITSNDTANDFKKQNVDLYGSLTKSVGSGQNVLDAFVGIVNKVGTRDKDYQSLSKKAAAESNDDNKKAIYDSMASILMAKGIGKTVQDRQALTGLLGMIQQGGKYQSVLKAVRGQNGEEINLGHLNVADTAAYKTEQAKTELEIASGALAKAIDGPLKGMLDSIISVSRANPVLAASATAAATALAGIATAAATALAGIAAAGGVGLLTGGKGALAGAAGGLGARVAGMGSIIGRGALAAGTGLMTAGAGLVGSAAALPVAAVGATGFLGYGAGSAINRNFIDGTALGEQIGKAVATALAAMGNQNAKQMLQVNLQVDGKQISSVVNEKNSKEMRRR